MGNSQSYIATVFLWPTKHSGSVDDPEGQRRLRAFREPLTPLVRRFVYLPKAVWWCKLVVSRKKRATRWWMVEEEIDGHLVMVQNAVCDPVPYTPEEMARLEAERRKGVSVMRQVWLRLELAAQVDAWAKSRGMSFSEVMVRAVVEVLKRTLDESVCGAEL